MPRSVVTGMEDRIVSVTIFILAVGAATFTAATLGYILYYDIGLSRLAIRHGAVVMAAFEAGALVATIIAKRGK